MRPPYTTTAATARDKRLLRRLRSLMLVAILFAGCRSTEKNAPWSPPVLASPGLSPATKELAARWTGQGSQTSVANEVIQQASLAFAKHLHRDNAFALAELH